MPSYRAIMTVTTLAPGRAPEEVEAAARSDAEARALHREINTAVRLVADVPRARLAAVVRGRSHYLAP